MINALVQPWIYWICLVWERFFFSRLDVSSFQRSLFLLRLLLRPRCFKGFERVFGDGSLLQSVRAMKHQLRLQGPSHDGAHQQLALLIDALTKFVSKLDHMLHKSLLTEVFSLNVWCVSKV